MATAIAQLISGIDQSSISFDVKLFKPLDEVLRCHICFEYFTDCMVTKCSHNYCSLCIRRYMAYKSQCPTCFKSTSEPELQNNRLIDEILQIYIKLRESLQLPSESSMKNLDKPCGSKEDGNQVIPQHPSMDTSGIDVHCRLREAKGPNSISSEVTCPVCYNAVPNNIINVHLDRCLKQSKERSERKYLPKLVYHLLKDKQIKEKLKEHGLSTSGDRNALIKRYKSFVLLFNANCDSLQPKPVSDLLLEVERQELEEKLNSTPRNISVCKKSDPSVIDHLNETYVEEHKSQFASLLKDVQQREFNRFVKTEKDDSDADVTSPTVEKAGKQIEAITVKQEPCDSLTSTESASETSDEKETVSTPKKHCNRSKQSSNRSLPYRIKKNIKIKLKNEPASDISDEDTSTDTSSSREVFPSSRSQTTTQILKKKNVRKLSIGDGNGSQRKK